MAAPLTSTTPTRSPPMPPPRLVPRTALRSTATASAPSLTLSSLATFPSTLTRTVFALSSERSARSLASAFPLTRKLIVHSAPCYVLTISSVTAAGPRALATLPSAPSTKPRPSSRSATALPLATAACLAAFALTSLASVLNREVAAALAAVVVAAVVSVAVEVAAVVTVAAVVVVVVSEAVEAVAVALALPAVAALPSPVLRSPSTKCGTEGSAGSVLRYHCFRTMVHLRA